MTDAKTPDIKRRADFKAVGDRLGSILPVIIYDRMIRKYETHPAISADAINNFHEMLCCAVSDRGNYGARMMDWLDGKTSTVALRGLWEDVTSRPYMGKNSDLSAPNAVDTIDSAILHAKQSWKALNDLGDFAVIAATHGAPASEILRYDDISYAHGYCTAVLDELPGNALMIYTAKTFPKTPLTSRPAGHQFDILFGSPMERLAAFFGANSMPAMGEDKLAFAHGYCDGHAPDMTPDHVAMYGEGLLEIRRIEDERKQNAHDDSAPGMS